MMIKRRHIDRTIRRFVEKLIGASTIRSRAGRRRKPIAAYTVGSVALAVASGVAALLFSRARSRSLTASSEAGLEQPAMGT